MTASSAQENRMRFFRAVKDPRPERNKGRVWTMRSFSFEIAGKMDLSAPT